MHRAGRPARPASKTMRQAHILIVSDKGVRIIGPGPVGRIRAEADQLVPAKGETATLYVDGRRPRDIGPKSITAYFEIVAKENAVMREAARKRAEALKPKTPAPPTITKKSKSPSQT